TGSNFSPETVVVASGVLISDRTIPDTRTITFKAPPLPSGRGTITVQNRGGLAHKSFVITAVPMSELPVGHITTVAGGNTFAGEGGFATTTSMNPKGLAIDSNGNLFIADEANDRVRRVDARTEIITTVAGLGRPDKRGDDRLALTASIDSPDALAFDRAGNLFILSEGIRRVDAL